MNFFKSVAGFFLYIGSLVAPVSESSLDLRMLSPTAENLRVKSVFEFAWDDKSTDIVNSAIPVKIKYTMRAGGERQELYKILRKAISESDFSVIDSIPNTAGTADGNVSVRTYPNIQLALRNFRQIEWEIPLSSERIDLTAEVEKSFVPSMNLYVDISPIFGGSKFVRKISVGRERRGR